MKAKFSGTGLVKADALEGRVRNKNTAADLAAVANFGLSSKTKETYQTSINHIKKCQEDTGVDLTLPFDLDKTLEFIGWMRTKGLMGSSMSTYLSGVRMYHIAVGFNEPPLRQPLVKLILKGQGNIDMLRKKMSGDVGKLPVTVNMMKLIKLELGKVSWPMTEVRLFWAVACLAWAGSFRVHELLSRSKTGVDPQTTLFWSDIKMGQTTIEGKNIKTLSIHVKSPKVERVGNGDNILVFEMGGFMCPIAAMRKYRDISGLRENSDKAVFRHADKTCFTGKEMNGQLKELTKEVTSMVKGGKVTSHSFRAGVASEMARAGCTEEELMAVGRWSSRAYMDYIKLGISHRAALAMRVARG